jgi:glucose/arabinose dehydrogenase
MIGASALYVAWYGAPEPVLRVANRFRSAPRLGGEVPLPAAVVRTDVAGIRVEEVARDLETPWAMAWAPDGRMFVTELPGRISVVGEGVAPVTYLDITDRIRGREGLMGIALHPDFPEPPFLFAVYTFWDGPDAFNRVSRFTVSGQRAGNEHVLVDRIPGGRDHNGGGFGFGPDGMLYVGTGDGGRPDRSQDLESLGGKILRIVPDGNIPPDNPLPGSPVYAYGFRNVSALAWQPDTGHLWAASHGPSGEFYGLRNRDSVFVVRRGGNHGWPLVVGRPLDPGIQPPVLYYPEAAVPPGGTLFYTGSLFPEFDGDFFIASLGAAHLQRVIVNGSDVLAIERWWPGRFGRLRAIGQGPAGAIYFTTSNRDERPTDDYPGTDFIFRIVPG